MLPAVTPQKSCGMPSGQSHPRRKYPAGDHADAITSMNKHFSDHRRTDKGLSM